MPEDRRIAVVDASVVLKWQFEDEEYGPQATELRNDFRLRRAIDLIAPQLLVYEVINGIVTAAKRKRLSMDKALPAMRNLLGLGIELKEVEPTQVLEASLNYNLAAYDAAYLALAECLKCDLWTGDRAFYQSMKDRLAEVRWIGDYTLPKAQPRHTSS